MPRPNRSEADVLIGEVRALEMLASETPVSTARIQEYWQLSADLISLATDVEEAQSDLAVSASDSPEVLALRQRIREVAARLMELSYEE